MEREAENNMMCYWEKTLANCAGTLRIIDRAHNDEDWEDVKDAVQLIADTVDEIRAQITDELLKLAVSKEKTATK